MILCSFTQIRSIKGIIFLLIIPMFLCGCVQQIRPPDFLKVTPIVNTPENKGAIIVSEQSSEVKSIFYLGMKYEDITKLDLYNTDYEITSSDEISDNKNSWDYGHKVIWTQKLNCVFDRMGNLYRIAINCDVPTSLGLKNGDTLDDLVKLYGESNKLYKFNWGMVYEYVIGKHYFFVSVQDNKVSLWGVSKYKYDYNGE